MVLVKWYWSNTHLEPSRASPETLRCSRTSSTWERERENEWGERERTEESDNEWRRERMDEGRARENG